ncbi:alpha/beta hydrolase [uncultured Amnibacterium sp.]|uniref:alpha/beta hydrolase n=1 Tax=uncultured Amnibacterium sp. TaxID=1631851 RepID=UPI0035CC5C7C
MPDSPAPTFAAPAPYDPSFAEVLDLLPGRLMPSAAQIDVLRGFPTASLDDLRAAANFDHEERTVPGRDGAPAVLLSIFTPTTRRAAAPVLYHVHGGGMVSGDRFNGVEQALGWVERLGVVVVSVEYRLAPEHPHPAPIEDCYTGLVWLAQHADDLGVAADRIIVYGASAGGGLAAGLALMARDRAFPTLAGQLLDSPMLDDRNGTVSSHQFDDVGIWDRVTNDVGWTALLGEGHAFREVSPYAAPARASNLGGLPPTYLLAAAGEVFRDEAVDYASRVWAAGGSLDLHVYSGAMHSYKQLAPDSPVSRAAAAGMDDWVSRMI